MPISFETIVDSGDASLFDVRSKARGPQGTPGMYDSLAYRNDAATVFKRLIRSLPTRSGVMGVATCDKGLPAMMMALAAMPDLPCILVPGGVTLLPEEGEDAGRIQTIGVRFTHGLISVQQA